MKKRLKKKLNRTYKDTVFRLAFKEKRYLLDLYNALNGTAYDRSEDLMVTTIENAIYLGMKNDISFLIEDVLNLYEHQSTMNENMPLRGLIYFSELYKIWVDMKELNIYRNPRLELPFPQYLVFYNGTKEEPEQQELRLSDSFVNYPGMTPSLECVATVLNINRGNNQELMERCQRLKEYSFFVSAIRVNLKSGMAIEQAVERAIDTCLEMNILSDILIQNRSDIVNTLLTTYDAKKDMEYVKKYERTEGREEGRKEGREEERTTIIQTMLLKGQTVEEIHEVTDIPVESILKVKESL